MSRWTCTSPRLRVGLVCLIPLNVVAIGAEFDFPSAFHFDLNYGHRRHPMNNNRLLFASIHSYLDPSSGASLATRELLEILAARGWDCRALTCGVLDYQQETPLEDVLTALDLPAQRASAALSRGGQAEVFDLELDGVRLTLLPTAHSRAERAPSPFEANKFLDVAGQVLHRFRPRVLLTYGGHPVSLQLMQLARTLGVAVVFHLHNFGYNDRRGFNDVSTVIFPSEYSRQHFQRKIGLDGTVIPDPIRLDRVVADNPEPKFVTFINPQPDKGATVFARIALELNRRRPDIPLLVVEGRGTSDTLAHLPVDLSGLTNLNRMANTPDPRDFYRVTRVVLMPSLWRESLGRVPIEAMANGIPVLASDRGALPETLGDAGFVFTIPERCTPTSGAVPTAQEVAPWVGVIERLWDDPSFESSHRERAKLEARRWNGDSLAERYAALFHAVSNVIHYS
jgi:glycosyltransferase involved in cell wall biosynthesis